MRYTDKDNQSISHARWWELIHDPDYTAPTVAVELHDGRTASVCWVGETWEEERTPSPWLFQVRAPREPWISSHDAAKRRKGDIDEFHPTQAAAEFRLGELMTVGVRA